MLHTCATHISYAQKVSHHHSYLTLSAGINRMKLRDKGTSPLIYEGALANFALGYLSENTKNRLFKIEAQYASGILINQLGTESSQSLNHTLWLRIQKLHFAHTQGKFKWMLGATIDATNNVRINKKLMNNSLGMDFVQNLFATANVQYALHPKENQTIDLYFFKIKNRADRLKYLNFQLNLPIWHSEFRNGYAYSNQAGVINGLNHIHGYQFKIWNGLRIVSKLSLQKVLKNKNSYEWSYLWDVYKNFDRLNQLTAAHHSVQFSLWYNLK